MVLSLSHLVQTFTGSLPAPLNTALRYTAPLQIVNTYGLFAVMTTTRLEIIIEGRRTAHPDALRIFAAKPGNLTSAPRCGSLRISRARLADVVRGAEQLPVESMIRELRGAAPARLARGHRAARFQSFQTSPKLIRAMAL